MAMHLAQAPERDAVIALFARRQAAFAKLDADALAADYAADAVIESPFAGTHHGNEARAGLHRFFGAFRDLTVELAEPLVDGARVAQIGTIAGSGTNGLMGLPPTDRAFRVPVAVFYELRALQIISERRIYDATGLWIQSGLLTVKPK